jgi:phenylalanyl-tRNA synthetase beta chain
MKYSYNWIKELTDTKLPLEKAVELLTMHSLEIEGVEKIGNDFKGVIVGKILEIKKHPNADKLQLAKVDTGKEVLDIVCGAPNIQVGNKVPVALVGAILPGGFEIKEAEIRGEKSFGMLLAEDELGLGDDHSGIIILAEDAKVGDPISKYLGVKDEVIEIKVLPDRAHDALSHVGVARELSVLEGREFDYDFDGLKLQKKKSKKLKVEIKDKDLCYRYIGAVMENLTIKESPKWMRDRLQASGIRAINNVVDATNYIMLELGNPLHAFDAEKIRNNQSELEIVVRRAEKGEKMTLLDETELKLSENNLLITNGETPLALAGIMGGRNSGISDDTKTIVLESASFNATNIRRSRTNLNLKTESSDRFEKGLDPNLAEKAMVRIIGILEHTAGAKLEGIVDIYPNPIKPWKIKLDPAYVDSLLGETVPTKDMLRILNLLGIKAKKGKTFDCEIPTQRLDLRTPEDLIEEVGRIWGYEKVKEAPLKEDIWPAKVNEQVFFERRVQDIAVGLGYDEVYNYSFYSEKDTRNCGLDAKKHLELARPMNPDQQFVRVSLVPNILKNIKEDLKYYSNIQIFEEGRVYSPGKDAFPKEERILVLAKVLEKDAKAETFFDLKGDLEDLISALGITNFSLERFDHETFWHPERSAEIIVSGKVIGRIGEVDPSVLSNFKIKNRVAVAEINLEKLRSVSRKEKSYLQINRLPSVFRDISLIDRQAKTVAEIMAEIRKAGGKTMKNLELFDVFEKDGQNSYAFHLEFNAGDRTMEGKEIDAIMEEIIAGLEKELGVEVRK